MEAHHREAIARLVQLLEPDSHILALILGGSLAHGFARTDSDVDVVIVVAADEFQLRTQENRLHYLNRELCGYPGGYVDGKYVDLELLSLVPARGSEPARYAYKDSQLLIARDPAIERVLAQIVRYPTGHARERIERFAAHLLAWQWYYREGARQQNQYLMCLAIQKIVLFSGRIVLTRNALLYPYHKWLLAELGRAQHKPENLLTDIADLLAEPSEDKATAYCRRILAFAECTEEVLAWPNQFIRDSELNWVHQAPPVDDM
jgi:predicted nucleotidyltransferase